MTDKDMVNHPPHYTSHPSGVECIQITRHMVFNLGNALKYIWRADLKHDAIEDLNKAIFYLQDEIALRENKLLPNAIAGLSAEDPIKKHLDEEARRGNSRALPRSSNYPNAIAGLSAEDPIKKHLDEVGAVYMRDEDERKMIARRSRTDAP